MDNNLPRCSSTQKEELFELIITKIHLLAILFIENKVSNKTIPFSWHHHIRMLHSNNLKKTHILKFQRKLFEDS